MSLEALRDKRIAVLAGGDSGEREVSLRTGAGVHGALTRQGFDAVILDPRPDLVTQLREAGAEVVYNALHGGAGENGCIQGALEVAHIPYTGCGVLASALTMDKRQCKRIFMQTGIPTPPHICADAPADPAAVADEAIAAFGLPAVVKPINQGSSLGVSIPKTRAELISAVADTLQHYGACLVDQYIAGTEITVGIVGTGEKTMVLPVLELVPKREFYDYVAKYTKGLTELIAPARISPQLTRESQQIALHAHRTLGCDGVSRVDMHIDRAGRCWVHEINSVPGMTETSDLPAAAAAAGISYDELVLIILESAVTRMRPRP